MNEGTDATRTVENDGITVRKTIEADGRVRLEIDSERDAVATVRVTDPTLDSHPNEEIQFDTDHVSDWILEDGPVFERVFDPGERRTVRYRIPDADPDALDAEPRVLATDGRDLDGIVDRARSDALREFVGGDRDSLDLESTAEETDADTVTGTATATDADTAIDADTATDADADVDADEPLAADGEEDEEVDEITLGAEADVEAEEPTDETDDAERVTAEEDAIDAAASSGSVARALVEELRNDRVDDETAAALRAELGREEKRSLDVRLTHLQSEVSDLAAYTDTIESFIDRHGTFDSVIDDVRSELSALEERTERIDSTVDALSETVDRIDDIDDDVEDVRSVQTEIEAELEALRERQTDFESRFEGLDDELENVRDRLDDLERFEDRLSGVFRDLQPGGPDE